MKCSSFSFTGVFCVFVFVFVRILSSSDADSVLSNPTALQSIKENPNEANEANEAEDLQGYELQSYKMDAEGLQNGADGVGDLEASRQAESFGDGYGSPAAGAVAGAAGGGAGGLTVVTDHSGTHAGSARRGSTSRTARTRSSDVIS